MATKFQKYTWGSAQEAVKHTGENYEKYFVPAIGLPSAKPIIDAAKLQNGERVLDIGCGTGIAARLAAEKVGVSGKIVGVDPTPPMLAIARNTSPEIEWLEGNAENLPLENETIDVAISSLSFQFFNDKAKALKELYRVLVSGGRIAIGTPGPTPPLMDEIDKALVKYVGPDVSKFIQGVFTVHDPKQVTNMLKDAGFKDISAESSPITLRLPPPADFFWQYVNSTPLAGIVTELDDDSRAALEQDVVKRCQKYFNGENLIMKTGLLVAAAYKP